MKVFLSWSGGTSHEIALKLYDWLPMVIQKVEPYISTEIDKGSRWATDIAQELESSNFGIACVTKENKVAPWLLFEAGALSKSVEMGRLAPVLFGLEQSDIQSNPITQFQMTKFGRIEFLRLLTAINEALEGEALEPKILEGIFSALWPSLERDVAEILKSSQSGSHDVIAGPDKILGTMEEILSTARSIAQTVSAPEKVLPEDYLLDILRRRELSPSIKEVSVSSESLDSIVHIRATLRAVRDTLDESDNRKRVITAIVGLNQILRASGDLRYVSKGFRRRRPVEASKDQDIKGLLGLPDTDSHS